MAGGTDILISGWGRLVAVILAVLTTSGCSPSKPPYTVGLNLLTPGQFSTSQPPEVLVRPANPEEIQAIADFPGKKGQEFWAKADSAGSLVLAPVLLVFLWPEFINPKNWHFRQDPAIKEAVQKFPDRLTKAIEQRLVAASARQSGDRLEVVYVAAVSVIGPAADRTCFVVHARLTYHSKGEEVYRDNIRIDPRAHSDDIPQPDCTTSPERIRNYADVVIPQMIQTRLPGLPWQVGRP